MLYTEKNGRLDERNRIDVKPVNNQKGYLKFTSKPSYMLHKIFDNNLVAIPKRKVALKLNKPAYIRMCILKLSKVLMRKFHYDYLKKNKYDSGLINIHGSDSLKREIKNEDGYEDFSSHK